MQIQDTAQGPLTGAEYWDYYFYYSAPAAALHSQQCGPIETGRRA